MDLARAPLPRAALALGAAGLLPPAAAAAALFLAPEGAPREFAWVCLVFYGALILSFLGGTWWAFAAARPRARWLAMAIAPSLFALALLLLVLSADTRPWAAGLLACAILLSLVGDQALHAAGLTPGWWMKLRIPLSVALAACVALGAWRAPLG